MRVHLIQPQRHLIRNWRHHAALAVRTGRGYAGKYGDPVITDETLNHSTRDHSKRAMLSESAFIPAMLCAAWNSDECARARRLCRLRRHPRHPVSQEAMELGGAHAVVKGDGDVVWGK